ncbi:hypothetical protein CTA1_6137 [Colletotrichum tanaceti]|uniref:Uncharacterized protein n=1 Tax=Colletotrichum tanaceti TaxID=1306861 RepID=A0A4U6X8B7_9PEZI|nr:hypothetical protein CTA1_6137 [Colletotrichum tanaceti]
MGGDVDQAKVEQAGQHVAARLGEGVCVICPAELEAGEEEEEAQHVGALHPGGVLGVIGGLEPQQQQGPDLGVGLLQEEGEAGLGDANCGPLAADELAGDEQVLNGRLRPAQVSTAGVDRVDDIVQDVLPLAAGVAVEEGDRDLGRDGEGGGHAERVVGAAALEGEAQRALEVRRELHFLGALLRRDRDLEDVEAAERRDGLVFLPARRSTGSGLDGDTHLGISGRALAPSRLRLDPDV